MVAALQSKTIDKKIQNNKVGILFEITHSFIHSKTKNMKFLAMVVMVVCSVAFTNAQTGGGLNVDKNGVSAKGKKGGVAKIDKHGAAAKGSKSKGVEADKKGTRTTPK